MNNKNDINDLNDAGRLISPQEILDLWMPFEIEIGWLTSPLSSDKARDGAANKAEQQRLEKVIWQRRELLERVLAEAESGDDSAHAVIEMLEIVMRLFSARVIELTNGSDITSRTNAAGQGSEASMAKTALTQLAQDAEFLRHATAYATRLQNWVIDAAEKGRLDVAYPAARKPIAPRLRLLPPELLFFNDAVHATAVKALSRPGDWAPMDGFAFAFRQSHDKSSITIGLPTGAGAEGLWDYLRRGGPRMVKAHYALWARYYHDVDEGGMQFALLHVAQFCADIGLKKHKNGGYRREQKQDALRMLHALTSVVMSAEKTLGRKLFRVRGPLWTRGLEAESRDTYGDLFIDSGLSDSRGASQSETSAWEPVAFSFAPGPWFHDSEWRRYHRYVGKVGVGLLQLDNREEWAILVGGYLAMLGRSNAYRPLRLKVDTILEEAGLVQSVDARRRHAENRLKLENALDRLALEPIGVIAQWRYLGCALDDPDMDNADALIEYSKSSADPSGPWREWMIEILLPYEVERDRLESRRTKAIAQKEKKHTASAPATALAKSEPVNSETTGGAGEVTARQLELPTE